MKICLFRTKNGWIIHTDDFFTSSNAGDLLVFRSMKEACFHLQDIETPNTMPKRLPNGRFIPRTPPQIPASRRFVVASSNSK